MLIVPRVRSCSSSPVSVHGRWPSFVARGGSRASWFVGDGEGRGWASPLVRSRRGCRRLCPLMGAGHQLWAVAAGCGRPWLGGGSFQGGGRCFRGWSVSSRSNNSLGRVLACEVACHVIVVLIGGGCEQMAMVVGGGGCWRRW